MESGPDEDGFLAAGAGDGINVVGFVMVCF